MNMIPVGMPEITEDHIQADQGRVRALVIHRYEQLWAAVAPHLDPDSVERPDPRMLQIGLHVLRGLEREYRLEKSTTVVEVEDEMTDEARTRALVTAALDQLEAGRLG